MTNQDDNTSGKPLNAPGWDAIDQLLSMSYGGQTPHQYTSQNPYEPESMAPLPAITVWETADPASWHFVTYGLTELFEKESNDPNISGFGFEITMRVPKVDGDTQPPGWPLQFLQAIGGQILEQRGGLDSGHCVHVGGPIGGPDEHSGHIDQPIVGVACVPDPLLNKVDTPNGAVLFLRLIGLKERELETLAPFDIEATVGSLAELNPNGITDIARKESWLDDQERSKVIRRYQAGLKL